MRTGRSLTVCWHLLSGGGVCLVRGRGSALREGVCFWRGGVCSGGGVGVCSRGCLLREVSTLGVGGLLWGRFLLLGGVCFWGVSAPEGGSALGSRVVSQHSLRQTPPPWTESQMPVETLPWPNFVAAGNNRLVHLPSFGVATPFEKCSPDFPELTMLAFQYFILIQLKSNCFLSLTYQCLTQSK